MVYVNHIYVAVGGRLGLSEQWQTGFRMVSEDYADPDKQVQRAADNLDDIEAHLQTWWTAVSASALSGAAHWDFTKVNAIGPDGRYLSPTTNAIYYEPDAAGHQAQGVAGPFQTALALSLTTGFTRGRAHGGRMYLPVAQSPISSANGQITNGTPDALAADTATLFTNLNDNPGFDLANTRVAIVSEYGPFNDVIGVKAGKVVDTQRRRRKGLDENYGPVQPVTGQG